LRRSTGGRAARGRAAPADRRAAGPSRLPGVYIGLAALRLEHLDEVLTHVHRCFRWPASPVRTRWPTHGCASPPARSYLRARSASPGTMPRRRSTPRCSPARTGAPSGHSKRTRWRRSGPATPSLRSRARPGWRGRATRRRGRRTQPGRDAAIRLRCRQGNRRLREDQQRHRRRPLPQRENNREPSGAHLRQARRPPTRGTDGDNRARGQRLMPARDAPVSGAFPGDRSVDTARPASAPIRRTGSVNHDPFGRI